ncbi:MAG: SIS domain-containing protein [Candidatus Solibacter sp.]|jgi:D-sedoheptulose 7-phosphate isomerase
MYFQSLREAIAVFESLNDIAAPLRAATEWCVAAFQSGGQILICGNGGSAAEAQHLAGELVGRYKRERPALPAVALTADSAILTCIGNDYRFEDIFARQIHALGRPGDILVVFTTSGNSPSVLNALIAGRERGLKSIAFLGRDGGKARDLSDGVLLVRHADTARVQEGHQFLMHCLMDGIEDVLSPQAGTRELSDLDCN